MADIIFGLVLIAIVWILNPYCLETIENSIDNMKTEEDMNLTMFEMIFLLSSQLIVLFFGIGMATGIIKH